MSGRLVKTVALVGLMGAGKTTVGRRLAEALGAPFVDSDEAIVEAAGMDIPDIFSELGEAEFGVSERRVIVLLLSEPPAERRIERLREMADDEPSPTDSGQAAADDPNPAD